VEEATRAVRPINAPSRIEATDSARRHPEEEEHEAAGEERGERRWRGRTAAWRAWVPESPSAARSAEPSVSSSSSHTKALNPSSVAPIYAGWFEFGPLTQLVEVD
jgi:hypothetical protein